MKNLRDAAEEAGVVYVTALGWIQRGLLKAGGGGRQKVEYRLSSVDVERLRLLGKMRGYLSWRGFEKFAGMVERDSDVRSVISDYSYALVRGGGVDMLVYGVDRGAELAVAMADGYVVVPLGRGD